jgi:hypothetical protein
MVNIEKKRFLSAPVGQANLQQSQLAPLSETAVRASPMGVSESVTAPHALSPSRLRQAWKLSPEPAADKREIASVDQAARFNAAHENFQNALAALKEHPHDRNRQDAAHEAHAALAQQPMPLGHRGAALINKALKVGLAGSASTFGVGRTLGLHIGAHTVPADAGPGLQTVQRAAAQLGLGAVGGAIGNLAGQYLVAPVVDSLPSRFQAVDPAAVLPDRMVAKMNRIRSGWGNEMRAAVVEQQKETQELGSNTNIHFGEKAFSAATVARLLLLPPGFKPNLPQSVVLNSATSVVAGGAVGLNMGVNMARSNVRIPLSQTLDRLLADPSHPQSQEVAMQDAQSVPLFYAHRTKPEKTPPVQRIPADLRSLGQSIAVRSDHLTRATALPVAIANAQPFVVAHMPNDFSARLASLALPALAIKFIIRPWYKALVGSIPRRDAAAVQAKRQASEAAPGLDPEKRQT